MTTLRMLTLLLFISGTASALEKTSSSAAVQTKKASQSKTVAQLIKNKDHTSMNAAQLEDLVLAEVGNGRPDDDAVDAFNTMTIMINDELIKGIETSHKTDQELLHKISAAFDSCGATKASVDDELVREDNAVDKSKSDHQSCRLKQKGTQDAFDKANKTASDDYDDLQSFKNAIRGCPSEFPAGPKSNTDEGILEFTSKTEAHLTKEYETFNKFRAAYYTSLAERTKLKDAMDGIIQECHTKQSQFEVASCATRLIHMMGCHDYRECWQLHNEQFQSQIPAVNVSAEQRKNDLLIYKRLLCYIRILTSNVGTGATKEDIKTCQDVQLEDADAAKWKIDFPTAPKQPDACKPRDGPGDDAWRQDAYVDVPEGVELDTTLSCAPLPPFLLQ